MLHLLTNTEMLLFADPEKKMILQENDFPLFIYFFLFCVSSGSGSSELLDFSRPITMDAYKKEE